MEAAAVIISGILAFATFLGAVKAYREQGVAGDARLIAAQELQIAKLEARIKELVADNDECERVTAKLRQQLASGSPPRRSQGGL